LPIEKHIILKRISDSTYRIQHLQRWKVRKIVHFNQLKPCLKNIWLDSGNQPTSLAQPACSKDTTKSPQTVPNDIEIVEDHEIAPLEGDVNTQPALPTVWRNPVRDRHSPQCYLDFVHH